jgi:type II secretory pathway predicted ATPase ExeA
MVPVCPHHDVCQAPSRQAELMASIDEMSKGVGMMLERHEQLSTQVMDLTRYVTQVNEESLSRARIYIESNDSILKALRRLEGRENA